MGEIFLETNDNGKTVSVKGKLSILDSTHFRDLLLEACKEKGGINIDLSGAVSIDLACVQVLYAALKSCAKAGRPVRITEPLPEGVARSIQDMGVDVAERIFAASCQDSCAAGGGE